MQTTTASHPVDRRIVAHDGAEIVTFLETSAETGGARTTVETVLGPGTGTPLHTHATYSETFEVLEGTLSIEVDGRQVDLVPGERAVVPAQAVHRFRNTSDGTVRFHCVLQPGSRGFEEGQQIAAGLVDDGLGKNGLPSSPAHLGLLMILMDTSLRGPLRLAKPLFTALGRRAIRKGVDADLRTRYVRW